MPKPPKISKKVLTPLYIGVFDRNNSSVEAIMNESIYSTSLKQTTKELAAASAIEAQFIREGQLGSAAVVKCTFEIVGTPITIVGEEI